MATLLAFNENTAIGITTTPFWNYDLLGQVPIFNHQKVKPS